jgi:hypothetical protein
MEGEYGKVRFRYRYSRGRIGRLRYEGESRRMDASLIYVDPRPGVDSISTPGPGENLTSTVGPGQRMDGGMGIPRTTKQDKADDSCMRYHNVAQPPPTRLLGPAVAPDPRFPSSPTIRSTYRSYHNIHLSELMMTDDLTSSPGVHSCHSPHLFTSQLAQIWSKGEVT